MVRAALIAQLVFFLSSLIAGAQLPGSGSNGKVSRLHIGPGELCCFGTNLAEPIYPTEARLAHREGTVQLVLIFGTDGSVASVQAISGDPLFLDCTMKAVRHWRMSVAYSQGKPTEVEVPLTFRFEIDDPPKPAYLHFRNGKVVRADEVREFTDGIEYTAEQRTHHIPATSVTGIDGCARVTVKPTGAGDCVPAGGPSFTVRAIPLLPTARSRSSKRKAQSH